MLTQNAKKDGRIRCNALWSLQWFYIYICLLESCKLFTVLIIPHWVKTHLGNYKIAVVRPSVCPSGVISQRWLDGCFSNHEMLFPSNPVSCPSLQNFNIVQIGRLMALFAKSYIPHSRKSLCTLYHTLRNDWLVVTHHPHAVLQ